MFETIEWTDRGVVMLDQRRLPGEELYLTFTRPEEVAEAIRNMTIRGAPAIGVAAAMGLALGALRLAAEGGGEEQALKRMRRGRRREQGQAPAQPPEPGRSLLELGVTVTPPIASWFPSSAASMKLCRLFAATRPTAVNLFWAIERMKRTAAAAAAGGGFLTGEGIDASSVSGLGTDAWLPSSAGSGAGLGAGSRTGGSRPPAPRDIAARLVAEAARIKAEDIAACRAIGRHGAALVPDGATVLTHCNAGALATAGYGTALGVIRAAKEAGKRVRVFADETRPFLQGARLTAWELLKDGIETSSSPTAWRAISSEGGDRPRRRGRRPDRRQRRRREQDRHLPASRSSRRRTASPSTSRPRSRPSTSPSRTASRSRSRSARPRRCSRIAGVQVAPAAAGIRNPAFDVTPNRYVTAIITERGIARAPYVESLRALFVS